VKTQLDYQPTFHMKRETVARIIWRGTGGPSPIRWYHLEGHEGTKSSKGTRPQQPIHNSKDLERRRGIVHMCLLGRAWPTLPLMCYRVGMERRWKSTTLQTTQGHRSGKRAKTTRIPTHLSHEKKNCRWYHLEGHEGTKSYSLVSSGGARGDQVELRSHTTTTHTQLQGLGDQKGELPTYASQDEHGRHYHSCTTEWGWREDENQTPYK